MSQQKLVPSGELVGLVEPDPELTGATINTKLLGDSGVRPYI